MSAWIILSFTLSLSFLTTNFTVNPPPLGTRERRKIVARGTTRRTSQFLSRDPFLFSFYACPANERIKGPFARAWCGPA